MAKKFQYIDNQGISQTVEANDASTAIKTAKNIGQHSGVMELPTNNGIEQTTSSVRKDATEADTKLTNAQLRAQKRAEEKKAKENATVAEDVNYEGMSPEEIAYQKSIDADQKQKQKLINQQLELNHQQSATSNAMIQSIKDTFANRIAEMRDTNQKQYQMEQGIGLRESVGRARYAPKMQSQILTNEEQEGIQRVSALETQMNELVIKAEQAKNADDQKALTLTMNLYSEKYKQQQDAILQLYKFQKESEEARIKTQKAEQDQVEADFKLETDKAKSVAPAVKVALDKLQTKEQKEEFITKYAEKMGITDPDYLYSALETYGTQYSKDQLSMQSTRNSMYNSNRTQNRADEKALEEKTMKEDRLAIFQAYKDGTFTEEQAREAWIVAGFKSADFDKELL